MRYLLAIALEPIYDFLATEWRAADLKAGAELLTDIAKSAAEFLEQQAGCEMIFPASGQLLLTDKLVCLVEGEPHKVAQAVKEQVLLRLRAAWDDAYRQMSPTVQGLIDSELVKWQLKNFVEFYAAWVPLEGEYAAAYERLERILAGRKTLCDFKQPYKYAQHPKSSLNPALDSAFYTEAHGSGFSAPQAAQRDPMLRLKPRETLDAISLIKRVRGQRSVPSTREVALKAFESILPQEALDAYRALQHWQGRLGIDDLSDLLFQENWRKVLRANSGKPSWSLSEADRAEIEQSASKLQRALRERGIRPECLTYYAVLLANASSVRGAGRHMATPRQHQAFSECVAEFARRANAVVCRHEGYPIYCGDELLALLPANHALRCAETLRQCFESTLAPAAPDSAQATLYVSVVLVHIRENLQVALDGARIALQDAQRTRNALAVVWRLRNGKSLSHFTSGTRLDDWDSWMQAFHHGLDSALPNALRRLAHEWRDAEADALHREATRLLKHSLPNSVALAIPHWVDSAATLEAFVELLLIAQFLAGYIPKEKP
ncbi:MAG: hypothetical protein NZM28_02270 [Fimbriimonadales bacterium]|nr:hypothetical protein [Fimbriimonadales bacterium]